MASTYPSVVTSLTNPTATNQLNSPSHSTIESNQNNEVAQIETFVGTLSSAVGTLVYDIRATASSGGGHVQAANVGGTGQTSYTKGDILTASSSSVLSKLAIGINNTVLMADNTQSSGIKWGTPANISVVASVVTVTGTTAETSIMSTTIPSSVLSSGNAVRGTLYISNYTVGGASDTLLLAAQYGSNNLGSVLLSSSGASSSSIAGKIEYLLLANAASNAQRGELLLNWATDRLNPLQSSVLGVQAFRTMASSVNSMVNQTFGMTAKWGASIAGSSLVIDGYIVEKIT